tara:strand:- start:213 stop:620 length:408 start_codon:yes stop_codon:yes gene_type:complete
MKTEDKLAYCLANKIAYFDDIHNTLRFDFFPEWVAGMDFYIDDILYDSANWEAICDSMGLYDEDGDDFIEYHNCTPQQWFEIYGLFVEHMHYYFEEWLEHGKPNPSEETTWHLPCASMAAHFEEREQDYKEVRCA